MNSFSLDEMKLYLSKTLSNKFNSNKMNGLLAEIHFRQHVTDLGFLSKVSPGGWIVRSHSRGDFSFGQNTTVFFPETVLPDTEYAVDRQLPEPHRGLHTICATFHQIGIRSFFCAATVESNPYKKIRWKATELGIPDDPIYINFPEKIEGFNKRERRYNFEKHHADSSLIPDYAIPEEFSKEAIRVAFRSHFMAEISDIDGIFWGQERTYPLEIKEKTRATKDRSVGDYFGLDVGPFVKLAFYAAKRENLHSLFVVREIDDESTRNLVNWWYITFEKMAKYASWVFQGGGRGMTGGRSATIKIPANEFELLNAESLKRL